MAFRSLFSVYCKTLCVSQVFATITKHLRQLASTEEDLFRFTVVETLLQDPVASLLWAFGEGRAGSHITAKKRDRRAGVAQSLLLDVPDDLPS